MAQRYAECHGSARQSWPGFPRRGQRGEAWAAVAAGRGSSWLGPARYGAGGLAVLASTTGLLGHGVVRPSRLCAAGPRAGSPGSAVRARHGQRGQERHAGPSQAVKARRGQCVARIGQARRGQAVKAGLVMAGPGALVPVRQGSAVMARHGRSRPGVAGQDREARHRRSRTGMARRGTGGRHWQNTHGEAGPGRQARR